MLFEEIGFNSFSIEFLLLYIRIYDHMLNKLTSIHKKEKENIRKLGILPELERISFRSSNAMQNYLFDDPLKGNIWPVFT